MSDWSTSNRRAELPSDWAKLREEVLAEAHGRCQGERNGHVCGHHANQVDHKKARDDHSKRNLQALCRTCHALKSSAEGHAARWGKR